jgi:hypothetical protein
MDSEGYYYLNSGSVDNEYGLSERNNNPSIIYIFELRLYRTQVVTNADPGSARSCM